MAKYTLEEKMKIVQAYLNHEGGYIEIAKKYGIPDKSQVRQWVQNYRAYGEEGLARKREKPKYSFEFKLSMVESYLTSELSYRDLALEAGMTHLSTLARWVDLYRKEGPDGLRSKPKGRPSSMKKKKENKPQSSSEPASSYTPEEFKKLEEENLHLRIENAFLKELRRLRREESQRMKPTQESSTASEDLSD